MVLIEDDGLTITYSDKTKILILKDNSEIIVLDEEHIIQLIAALLGMENEWSYQ